MKKTRNTIFVTFRKSGIHCYPGVMDRPELSSQSYLANPHRHLFHFRVEIEVFTDDRDIEFLNFQEWLEQLYSGDILKLDHKSCEMISDELYLEITKKYPNRKIAIEVSEDGENGSYAEYDIDHTDLGINVEPIPSVSGEEPRKIYFVELGNVSDEKVSQYIEKFKEESQPVVDTPPKSKVDSHLELTFDQTMNKLDKVAVTPDLRSEPVKTSWWDSLKHTAQTLFGI